MSDESPRAVVADDSHFMRSVIADILEDGGVTVVERARNGREAVEAVVEHRPDVVTMDVEMPEMNGIEAVSHIMEREPTPVVMLSAHTQEDASVTFEALDAGAVDFVTKPGGEVSMELSTLADQLVEMVHSVAASEAPAEPGTESPDSDASGSATAAGARPTLVIGSSTGGPKMVERLLSDLPAEAGFRVLVAQHMPAGFTGRFAERIDGKSEYDVREAADGTRIGAGEALVAPGDKHLAVTDYRDGEITVSCTSDPPVNSVRPAVDVTMETAATDIDDELVGVVLTGMGTDGAAGIRAIKAAGGRTLVQDEATSAVFGMPKRAIETGDVDEVLPIDDLSRGIVATAAAEVN